MIDKDWQLLWNGPMVAPCKVSDVAICVVQKNVLHRQSQCFAATDAVQLHVMCVRLPTTFP